MGLDHVGVSAMFGIRRHMHPLFETIELQSVSLRMLRMSCSMSM